MSVLLVNGINVGALMAQASPPKGDRRDIGDRDAGSDGSLRVTRQTRKRDISFKTVPLVNADAYAWEAFLIGEGEAWAFDTALGLYGCKGTGPSASSGASLVTTHPKFGTKNLKLVATTGTITYAAAALNLFGAYVGSTVMVWFYESAAWHHYVIRSDGTIWKDGSTAGGPTASWLTVNTTTGNVTLANGTVADIEFDDLVVLPFKVLDTWPAVFGVATAAYTPPPYLDLSGDQVPEQAKRRALGEVTENLVKAAAASGVVHSLDVKLMAK